MPLFNPYVIDFKTMKHRLLVYTGLVNGLGALVLFFVQPAWLLYYVMGGVISYGYLLSSFLTSEHPRKGISIVMSAIRVALVGFLIAWVGHFSVLYSTVVIAGFLSYKIVLLADFVIHCIGPTQTRGH